MAWSADLSAVDAHTQANCADLSFYYTLVNKLRADKMCKGCSPPPPVWKSRASMAWGA